MLAMTPARYLVTLLAVVVAFASFQTTLAAPQQPNIVILLADDLGYSDLGCYGGEIRTPNLDALAANGVRFTSFYNTARCWPTRAALLTGYYAQQVRRDNLPGRGGKGSRPAWAPLLPVMLQPLGYRSYHSGKWHVDGRPTQNGFDHSYSLNGHDRYFHPKNHTLDDKPLPPVERDADYYATTAIADHAIDCLKDHAAKHADQPFFSYVAFIAPHFPLHAPAADIARYDGKYDAGWEAARAARWQRIQKLGLVSGELSDPERDLGPPYHFPKALKALGPGEVNRPLPWADLTPEQQRFQANKMEVHAAMVDRMDQEIGRIVEQLRAMNALDNTLILFLSDNGASAEIMVRGNGHDPSAAPGSADSYLCLGPGFSTVANTPFRRHKTWVHEGGIATPLIAHWPSGITDRGKLRRQVGHVSDIVPTVLAMAGAQRPGDVSEGAPASPGVSLVPALKGDAALERESLWWLHDGHRALRLGDWKIVSAKPDNVWHLYNLADDPCETNDLAAKHPEKVNAMAKQWQAMTQKFADDLK